MTYRKHAQSGILEASTTLTMQDTKHPIRPLVYLRISQDPRETFLGVDRQREDCLAYCARMGWPEPRVYVDNNISAYGGKHRPDYERLCADIRTKVGNVVVVSKFDRLSRRLRTTIDLCDLLLDSGATLHDLSGEADLRSAQGITVFQLAAVMAENKVRIDQENNKRARLQIARNGGRHVAARPYGWEAGGLVVRESEAVIVREMVERVISGESCSAIANDLNARGIPTLKDKLWTGVGVKKTVLRPTNAAIREHLGQQYDGNWEPIISQITYRNLLDAFKQRESLAYRRGPGRKYPFSGMVFCGQCGAKMSVRAGVSNRAAGYRCDSIKSHIPGRAGCGQVARNLAPVDYLITESILYRLDGDGLRQAVENSRSESTELQTWMGEASTLRHKLDELAEMFAVSEMTRAEYLAAKNAASARLVALERQITSKSNNRALARIDLSRSLRTTWNESTLEWKRQLSSMLITKVYIDPYPKSGYTLEWFGDRKQWKFNPAYVRIEWAV